MSLKNILGKITASIVALYLVLGNFAVAGLGIAEVIAETVKTPEITIEQNIDKYVQYEKNDYKGAIVQTSVKIKEETEKESYLPVKDVSMEISVPKVNGVFPSRVSIIKKDTNLTTGNEYGDLSQNYDSSSGLLVVSYQNTENYTEYKENAKDEFEIIYIYPELAFIGDNAECELNQVTKVKVNYASGKETLSTEKQERLTQKQTENKGGISNYLLKSSTDIYKGYMYANEKYGNTYKTDYKLTEELSILNRDLVNEVVINLDQSSYKDIDSKDIKANSIVYKSSKISSTDFYRLFGIDGQVDFYIGDIKYATIKYSDADEKGNRNYETIYYTVEKENIEAGKVEYPSNTKSVTIKTSNPTGEGVAIFENEKQIISQSEYEKEVKNLKEIKESRIFNANKTVKVNEEENIIEIENKNNIGSISLKEPTTKMSLELSSNKLSTLTTNKVTATLKIDDTNSSCKLLEAGNIELTLPQNYKNVKVTAKSLYENGITVKSVKIENGKVILDVKGKQTTYDVTNVSGGVNIVIDLEIDIKDTVATHKENLSLTYNGVQISKEIDIVSKSGILMESIIKNETKNTAEEKIINGNKDINVSINDTKQVENIELNIVNNLDKDVTNVEILGTLNYSDNTSKSTYNLSLEKAIGVTTGKVLYSEDNINWKESFTTNAKYFKIVLDNNKLLNGDSAKAILKVIVPENLKHNESSYIKYSMTYLNDNKREFINSTIGFVTEKSETQNVVDETKPALETSVQVLAGNQNVNKGDQVLEGQQLQTIVTLKNNSAKDNSYTINTTLENAVYYEKYVTGQRYNITGNDDTRYHEAEAGDVLRTTTITVPAGSTVQYTYQYVVGKDVSNVNNNIKVIDSNNNNVFEQNINNQVKNAKLKLSVEYAYNEEVEVIKTMSVTYKIQNFTNKALKNIEMHAINSNELTAVESECYENVDNLSITLEDDNKNDLSIVINELKANDTIEFIITYNVNIPNNLAEQKVFVYSTCRYNGDTYLSNLLQKDAYQSKTNLNMELSSNAKDNTIKAGDEVQFRAHITNSGVMNLENTKLYFNINKGMKLDNVYLIYADGSKQNITVDTSNDEYGLLNVNINKNDDITIVFNVTVNYIDNENVKIGVNLFDIYNNNVEKTVELKGIINSKQDNPNNPDNPDNPDKPNNPSNPDTPENPDNPNNPNNQEKPTEKKYEISGLAWLDSNKDGRRDSGEQLLSNIKVYLVNTRTGKIVIDSEGKEISVTTMNNGEYKFEGIEEGSYLVIFEFDTNKYKATKYQSQNVETTLNSDAIISKVTIDGNIRTVGATNTLELESDLKNIDLGLIENAKFDLSLEKQISKITVINAQGTKTTEYENMNFAKTDLVAKYMNNTSVIVTYKFVITNNGDVTGYVDNLKDNLPKGLEFSSELNKDWYKGDDGNLYTSSLSGIAIEPGKTSEVELVLTKETTENSTGTFTNSAELTKISNIEAIEETAADNNKSSADMVISIKTGSPLLYIGITLGSIALVAGGAYIIKKKILDREI